MANSKAVVKLGMTDAKSKKAAKKALVDLQEFKSLTLDLEKSTLVVVGDMDPTMLVYKLRKFVTAELVTFGPVKDEGKPQKNNGGDGNVDRQQRQPFSPPFDYGYGYGYGYH